MARSKAKHKKREKPPKVERAEGVPGLAGRLLKPALVLAAIAAGAGGIVYGFDRLGRLVQRHPDYVVARTDLALEEVPGWVPPEALDDLDLAKLDPEFPPYFSLLDRAVCRRVAEAYERSVWVEEVVRVEKRDPRIGGERLLMRLRFRRPAAFVRRGEALYLAAHDGVRLPGVYREPVLATCGSKGDGLELLEVRGVAEEPPAPGRAWTAESLRAGLRIVAGLEPRRTDFRLAAVDVSNFGYRLSRRRSEVAVYTEGQTEIRWGKAPTERAALLHERSVAEKVEYLDYVHRRVGAFDGVLEYVDIPNEVIRRRSHTTTYRLRS